MNPKNKGILQQSQSNASAFYSIKVAMFARRTGEHSNS
jgi:hypothetical protein